MRVRLTQGPAGNEAQIQHLDLSSAENIADSIALLQEENDRLRKIAASLIVETEDIRSSLSPAVSLVTTSPPKAFLGLS